MVILGLTGSIGMGKSTTAAMFRDAGVPVFDADAAVHALYRGAAVEPVEEAFPGVTKDGTVDRELLRQRVLDDPSVLRRLEAIVHPLVRAERSAFLAEAEAGGAPLAVLDIPLLFETGAEVDAVAVVTAPEPVQKARVLARPGMPGRGSPCSTSPCSTRRAARLLWTRWRSCRRPSLCRRPACWPAPA